MRHLLRKKINNDTCTIRRFSSSSTDAHGHPVKSWSDLATNVPYFLDTSARGVLAGDELVQKGDLILQQEKIFLAAGQDIREDDRIKIGSRTYEVKYVRPIFTPYRKSQLEVDIKLVRASDE